MAELFGFTIQRAIKDKGGERTFSTPTPDDGTIDVAGGGFFGQILDTDGRERSDIDLIRRYRDVAQQAECDTAIEDIVNEGIVSNQNDQSVEISLDRLRYPDKIKRKIRAEFDEVLRLLHFEQRGHDVFRRWYVDGRVFYHKIIDTKNPRKGITELRYIDSTKIKKVREVKRELKSGTSVDLIKKVDEYYLYNDKGIASHGTAQGIKFVPDSISYCPSGVIDQNKGHVLSYLHKAIKPVNQLRMIEDALVIYRISRAPERRIFYIDVGNLPKIKAEQYLKDVMNRYRNKLVYDATTGEIRDDRNHMSMLEDFWLPRREGGRGTEITTLPGGENLGELEDVIYFQKKLYKALNVPSSRLEQESGFVLGRAAEISRDEVKFTRFIERLRNRFNHLFNSCLEKQLILKGVLTLNDWRMIEPNLFYEWQSDSHFAELKEAEMLNERLSTLQNMNFADEIVGTFYSKEFIRKRILKQTDEEVRLIDKQIEAEAAAAGPEEEEEAFIPKQDKFMKEDIKLKKEMNEIMKGVLSES